MSVTTGSFHFKNTKIVFFSTRHQKYYVAGQVATALGYKDPRGFIRRNTSVHTLATIRSLNVKSITPLQGNTRLLSFADLVDIVTRIQNWEFLETVLRESHVMEKSELVVDTYRNPPNVGKLLEEFALPHIYAALEKAGMVRMEGGQFHLTKEGEFYGVNTPCGIHFNRDRFKALIALTIFDVVTR